MGLDGSGDQPGRIFGADDDLSESHPDVLGDFGEPSNQLNLRGDTQLGAYRAALSPPAGVGDRNSRGASALRCIRNHAFDGQGGDFSPDRDPISSLVRNEWSEPNTLGACRRIDHVPALYGSC